VILQSKFKNDVTDFKKIIGELQSFLSATARNPEKYRQKPTDFTRKRKLPFVFLCKFLAPFKKSLQTELNDWFKNGATCTKSAPCQVRKKLKDDFFEDLFKLSVSAFYRHHPKAKRWKNYRLWACDCTVQILPNNEETRKIGIHKNQYKEVASIKLSCDFDILNKILTSATNAGNIFGLFQAGHFTRYLVQLAL
jgi:hypothetical protein